ncbi:TAXI family TRAP transporter solute-binding subunit [Candidatus Hydrogenedentota bacterium]
MSLFKIFAKICTRVKAPLPMFLALGIAMAGCGEKEPSSGGAPKPKTTFVTIGTGGMTGVYYPAGGAIAKLLNKKQEVYGIRASAESNAGSVYNINSVLSGGIQFGLAQSDRQYQAVNGLAEWKDLGPQAGLRAVCSLHPEVVTLVAADNSDIKTLADLKGKRINIGNPGSGQRGNALDVLKTCGIDWEKDIQAEGIKAAESAKMLQDGRIDAFFYTVGHPNGSITEATVGYRKVHFVPITGMEKLLEERPYYAKATIPASLYPKASNKEDVATISVMTTVITSAAMPDNVVYALTKELFDNLEEFKTQHDAFARLTKDGMAKDGLSAPIHPGALTYYKEVGLME